MRIAVVSDLLRPNGAGVMALSAADMLTSVGHDVAVIAAAADARLEQNLERVHTLGARAFTHDLHSLDSWASDTDHEVFIDAFHRWFRHQLDDVTPDVLYVHNCGRVLSQVDLADLSHDHVVIHTMHDEWFISDAHYSFRPYRSNQITRTYEPHSRQTLLTHSYDHLFDVADRAENLTLVAPSNWLAQRARRVFPQLRVEHIPNAVDPEVFGLQSRRAAREVLGLSANAPIVLFVGNPHMPRKGFDHLSAALSHLSTPAITLIAGGAFTAAFGDAGEIVREGPIARLLAQPVPARVGRVHLDGNTLAVNGLDRSLMPAVYGAADVLVHPSRIDNLPTVPIEAGMCGTRCLASDVGGTHETIADTGDLFDADTDPGALAERIEDALRDAESEQPGDRSARRATQCDRFSGDAHLAALTHLLGHAGKNVEASR